LVIVAVEEAIPSASETLDDVLHDVSDHPPDIPIDRFSAIQKDDIDIGPLWLFLDSGVLPDDVDLARHIVQQSRHYVLDEGRIVLPMGGDTDKQQSVLYFHGTS
jgi:hypothetical protein